MNFLRKIFEKEKSHVSAKNSLEGIRQQMRAGVCSLADALFYSVIGPSTKLQKFNASGVFPSASIAYVSKNDYDVDGVAFELGSYFMMRADVYLFSNYPDWRRDIFEILESRFLEVFSNALRITREKTGDLLFDRMDSYGRLVRSDPDPNKIFAMISSAVHDTLQSDGMPQSSLKDRHPTMSAVDNLLVVRSLNNLEIAYIPQMHSAIDRIVANIRTNEEG